MRTSRSAILFGLIMAGMIQVPVPKYIADAGMLVSMEIAFVLAASLIVFARVNRFAGLYGVAAVVSAVYPVYDQWAALALHSVSGGLVWLLLVREYATADTVFDAVCVLALANFAVVVLQYMGAFGPNGTVHILGLMTNPNEVAALFALSVPAFCRDPWWLLLPLVVIGLCACRSAGAALGLAAGAMLAGAVLLPGWWRLVILAVPAAVVAVIVVHGPPSSSGNRAAALRAAWVLITTPPNHVNGCGSGHFRYAFPHLFGTHWRTLHNEWAQMIYEMGVFSAPPIIAGFFIDMAAKLRRSAARPAALLPAVGLVIAVVCAATHYIMHYSVTSAIALSYLAVLEKELAT